MQCKYHKALGIAQLYGEVTNVAANTWTYTGLTLPEEIRPSAEVFRYNCGFDYYYEYGVSMHIKPDGTVEVYSPRGGTVFANMVWLMSGEGPGWPELEEIE